ncbi:hypothetical protein [Desulfatibacillum aliphaticivorans]|nr:hypothetical protein [Desulfatibacillum aliphaticivorans]
MKSQTITFFGRFATLFLLIAALGALSFATPCLAQAQEPMDSMEAVDAIGVSKIYQGKVSNAREAATEDSFEMAVTKVVSEIVPPDVLASNFDAVNRLILSKTESFVQGFQVLAEAQDSTHLRIMTRVRVDHNAIQDALRAGGALAAQADLPVLLFLVNEKEFGQQTPRHWWGKAVSQNLTPYSETVMARGLAEKGFPSVDGRDSIRAMVSEPQFDPERFDLTSAMRLAKNAQAQVVIFGEVSAENATAIPGTDMASYEASVTIQAVNADTGERIATSSQVASVVSDNDQNGSRDAIAKASAQAAQELAIGLAAAYQTQPQGPVTLEIKVSGISPLANFVAFRNALKSDTEGVTRVLPKGMTDREALLMVEYKGMPQKLARDLTLKAFDRFSVHVSYIGESQMDLQLIPKDPEPAPTPGILEELPGN